MRVNMNREREREKCKLLMEPWMYISKIVSDRVTNVREQKVAHIIQIQLDRIYKKNLQTVYEVKDERDFY